jgi:hypothetical protein
MPIEIAPSVMGLAFLAVWAVAANILVCVRRES